LLILGKVHMRPSGWLLVIDDDQLFRDTCRDILEQEGYTVETALDRAATGALLDAGEWDVVIVDNKLSGQAGPDVGVDLLAEVSARAPGAKAIMVTGFVTPESIRRAFAAGAYDYLEKSGQFSTLLRVTVANAVASVRDRRLANLGDAAAERAIVELWQSVRTETDPHRKGKALEDLLLVLFRSIPGFTRVWNRATNAIEEIDILVRNESTDPFWVKEGAYFLFECKNWSKPVGRNEIDTFVRKLERRHQRCKLGFFVAVGGFTDPALKLQLTDSKDAVMVVFMDGDDLTRLVEAGDRSAILKDLHQRAVMHSNGSH
jgi:DNA-binding NarL/FixJ family response regulator